MPIESPARPWNVWRGFLVGYCVSILLVGVYCLLLVILAEGSRGSARFTPREGIVGGNIREDLTPPVRVVTGSQNVAASQISALPTIAMPTPAPASFHYCASGVTREWPMRNAYDAVFVLGTGVVTNPRADINDVLIDDARLRSLAGYLAVTRFGAATTLGFSGGHTLGPNIQSEAASMRRFVESAAFEAQFDRFSLRPVGAIMLEESATSTVGNIVEIGGLTRKNGWRRVLLVTNQFHLPRTALIAQANWLPAEVASAESIVDQALNDGQVHATLCDRYASLAMQTTIQREKNYTSLLRAVF